MICYKTRLKYRKSLKAILRRFLNFNKNVLFRGRLHGEFQPGLKFSCDYMVNFSPGAMLKIGRETFVGKRFTILVPRAYDLFCQRWDRRALVSAITGCREIHDIR